MKRHFTLIEMLIVVFIIVLLAGLGFAVGGSVRKAALRNAQAAEISKILTAAEKFNQDFGAYPLELASVVSTPPKYTSTRDKDRQLPNMNNPQGNAAISLARALSIYSVGNEQQPFSITNLATWTADYLNKDEVKVSSGQIIDLYGQPLIYWLRYKNGSETTDDVRYKPITPELWSKGYDKEANTNGLGLRSTSADSVFTGIDADNIGGDYNHIRK